MRVSADRVIKASGWLRTWKVVKPSFTTSTPRPRYSLVLPVMRKTRGKKYTPQIAVYQKGGPEALTRVPATNSQKVYYEGSIRYGDDDNLPLRIALAVENSPAASACIGTISQFITGSRFTDKKLMALKVDDSGTTLWELHNMLSKSVAIFEGFAANSKFERGGGVRQWMHMGFESCRFAFPENELSPIISEIIYNPYVGTSEFKKDYTERYNVWDEKKRDEQIANEGEKYRGQVYYWGNTSPIHRFYPVPAYWSAKNWISIDAKIQESHESNLDNGWFQSVLMTVIGDPNQWTTNPEHQTEFTDDNGQKQFKSTKTVGQEFAEVMSKNFSGSKKMGTVMVQWAANEAAAPKVEAFPTTANADLFLALQDLTTKNITIAFRVPSILANISEGVSLGSGGSEMQKAVELMQSRVISFQERLMLFYNEIMLPSMGQTGEVIIEHFKPISEPVEVDDKYWAELTTGERRDFIRQNVPGFSKVMVKDDAIENAKTLYDCLGKEGMAFLLTIVQNVGEGKISEFQGMNFVQTAFGIDKATAKKLFLKDDPKDKELIEEAAVEVPVDPNAVPDPSTVEKPISEAIKNLTGADQVFIKGIKNRFLKEEYNLEMATRLIQGKTGLSDADVELMLLGTKSTQPAV